MSEDGTPPDVQSSELFSNTHDNILDEENLNNSSHYKNSTKNRSVSPEKKSKSRSRSRSRKSESRSKERSKSRDRSGSRSRKDRRSKSRSRRDRRSRSRSYGRRSYRRSRSPEMEDGARLHVADIDEAVKKSELYREFERHGPLIEIWTGRTSPHFAFVVFKYQKDADTACEKSNGVKLGRSRIKVTKARPRAKFYGDGKRGYGGGSSHYSSRDQRCYQCGNLGHIARNCTDNKFGYKRPSSPRRSFSRSPSYGKSRYRMRSRTPPRHSRSYRSRSRDRKRSHSRDSRDDMRSSSIDRRY